MGRVIDLLENTGRWVPSGGESEFRADGEGVPLI